MYGTPVAVTLFCNVTANTNANGISRMSVIGNLKEGKVRFSPNMVSEHTWIRERHEDMRKRDNAGYDKALKLWSFRLEPSRTQTPLLVLEAPQSLLLPDRFDY